VLGATCLSSSSHFASMLATAPFFLRLLAGLRAAHAAF